MGFIRDRQQGIDLAQLRADVTWVMQYLDEQARIAQQEAEDEEIAEIASPTRHTEAELDNKIAAHLLDEPVMGTGTTSENGTPLALGPGSAAPSTAALTGDTKTWADAITAILQTARILV